MTDQELLHALDGLKATMIAVATGGPRIASEQVSFTEVFDEVAKDLDRREVQNPLPYRDLWGWYDRWTSGDMPSWQSRRHFVNDLFSELVRSIQEKPRGQRKIEPTGWTRVDRNVTEVRKRLETAATEEQFQTVGLLCRETLISLAQVLYDAKLHPTLME